MVVDISLKMRFVLFNSNAENNLCVEENSGNVYTPECVAMMNNFQQYSPSRKVKRFRSAFTTDQVNHLEQQFKKFPYIGNAHRKEVAMALNIPERAVKIWFQNRRMKEKKETGTKELLFDDDRSNRKSVEFAKDQLNNVQPSANDRRQYSYSLPSLTGIRKPIAVKPSVTIKPCDLSIRQPIGFVGVQYDGESNNQKHPARSSKKSSPPFCKRSAEFSMNICKKYKSERLNEMDAIDRAVCKEEIKQAFEIKPINQVSSRDEQILPEDLSSNKKANMQATSIQATVQSTPKKVTNPGYFSLIPTISPLYAQPYMAPGGFLWKPISMMPVVSSASQPVAAPNNQSGSPTGSLVVPKPSCNCDCHMKPVSMTMQQNIPNHQYIITALPFQNPSVKL